MFMLENTLKQNPCLDLHNYLIAVPHISLPPFEQLRAASGAPISSARSPNTPQKGFSSIGKGIPVL